MTVCVFLTDLNMFIDLFDADLIKSLVLLLLKMAQTSDRKDVEGCLSCFDLKLKGRGMSNVLSEAFHCDQTGGESIGCTI